MNKVKRIKVTLMSALIITSSVLTHNFYINKKQAEIDKSLVTTRAYVENEISYVMPRKIHNNPVGVNAYEAEKVVAKEEPKIVVQNTVKPKATLSRGATTKVAATPVKKAAPAKINGYTVEEIDLFSRLVSAEAEGESFEGKLAVATVIMNRVKSSLFPNTIKGVVYDKSNGYQQFTPITDGRINNPATSDAKKAVDMVIRGHRSFGSNILFFLNPKTSTSSWITKNKTYYQTIGNHQFYY